MKPRPALAGVIVWLVAAAGSWAQAPNVVLIIGDDQAWTDYGFMGHSQVQTPSLDRLASQSALFSRGYVPSSLCRPSLASLATGLYPHQHRITSNDPPEGVDRAEMLECIRGLGTLPRWLSGKGYRCLQTGKWWEGSFELGGFTHGMTHGDPERGGRHGDDGLKIGREGLQPIFEFIAECGEDPFFVWYAPFLPHRPHDPPERLLEKYTAKDRSEHVARYWAMCEWFDETCGELLSHLDEHGLRENTLVAFVADNGWIQKVEEPGYAPRSKRSPYDGGLRTPILLSWPGHIEPMRDEETAVLSIDLVPTILRACGVSPTPDSLPAGPVPGLPGIDLLDVCAGRAPSRERIFGEVFTHDAVDLDHPASSLLHRWCVEGRFKLILPQAAGEQAELYDLRADPAETQDLAQERPDLARSLTERINAWWRPD